MRQKTCGSMGDKGHKLYEEVKAFKHIQCFTYLVRI